MAPHTEEQEDNTMEFTFDFTAQRDEPVALPGGTPGHPPLILARGETLLPVRYGHPTD
ncbi:hypothetical protein [Streptomyces niveus]|uniref:hypothetical protein n=1 Tax=Streptomyces niveus TaxID=193462 RepID=UPI0037A08C51